MEVEDPDSNVKVAVRVRPLNFKEIAQGDVSVVNAVQKTITMAKNLRSFTFDQVFSCDVEQQEIFEKVAKNLVLRCFEGYNSTILAYGQTASGKTFTMGTMGIAGLTHDQLGMVPRVIYFIHERIGVRDDVKLKVSYLEIHNEQIIDLLDPGKQFMQIREEKDQSMSIPGLTEQVVSTPQQMLACLDRGGTNRSTASTNMNERSSRSHAIFTVHFQIAGEEEGSEVTAKFHFVDLAGSERLKKTQAVGKVMEEGICINQSLLVLGNVISLLSERQKDKRRMVHIPYRESKLTRLLQDSLGGNANTYMVACVSPAESNFEETLNSLKYASRAREIQNKPIINVDPQTAMIQTFKDQIRDLQSELEVSRTLLRQNNIPVESGRASQSSLMSTTTTTEEQSDTLKRLKMSLMFYEKQVMQLQGETTSCKKALSESQVSLQQTRRQRDQFNSELQSATQMLTANHLMLPGQSGDPSSQFQEYEQEQDHLRRQLHDRDTYQAQLQLEFDQLLRNQQRDQKLLYQKVEMIDGLKKSFVELKKRNSDNQLKLDLLRQEKQDGIQVEELSGDDDDGEMMEEDEDEIVKHEETCRNFESELEMVSQALLQEEGRFDCMESNNHDLKVYLAGEVQREYVQQINLLESEKLRIQKQHDTLLSRMSSSDQQERNQIQQLKGKVQQMEAKIVDMRTKDNQQKIMTKKMEEQDKQLLDLRGSIERMRKQKLELQKQLKYEGEKFVRFKDDRFKDVMVARKQKVTTDAQLRKLRTEKMRMEFLLAKKDTELGRQKQDVKLSLRKVAKNVHSSEDVDKHLTQVYEHTLRGRTAERHLHQQNEKINETLQQIGNEERKMFTLEVKREQLTYDINRLSLEQQSFDAQWRLESKQGELQQVQMELIDVNHARETMNEAAEYQRRKINELREVQKKSNAYMMSYLETQQGTHTLKVLKHAMEQWADHQLNSQEHQLTCHALTQQVTSLEVQLQQLQLQQQQHIDSPSMSPSFKKPTLRTQHSDNQEDYRRQLKDQKRKFQQLEVDYRSIKTNQEYNKNLLARYQTLHQKDKYIGLNKSDIEGGNSRKSHHGKYHKQIKSICGSMDITYSSGKIQNEVMSRTQHNIQLDESISVTAFNRSAMDINIQK